MSLGALESGVVTPTSRAHACVEALVTAFARLRVLRVAFADVEELASCDAFDVRPRSLETSEPLPFSSSFRSFVAFAAFSFRLSLLVVLA